jgi:nanoRNase/pAp phosphatase (c-di-AMP/oligoRNAs hydrolase)
MGSSGIAAAAATRVSRMRGPVGRFKDRERRADQQRQGTSTTEEAAVAAERYRLVTRSDFDGLVCAVLLQQLGLVEEIVFVHPKDVQDGLVEIGPGDITTNLPYAPQAHLVFDHHHSETLRNTTIAPNHVIDPDAPSAARVVYDHYGGADRFPSVSPELMAAVDQADSAQYSLEEVLHPTGWVLLNFLMDSRTGLGRFRQFRVSNYQLMMELIDACQGHDVDEILRLPDVKERVELYHQQTEAFVGQLRRCTSRLGTVAVVDLRAEDVIHAGNRFMVYALYPDCSVSVHVLWGKQRQNTVLAVGKSILNRSSAADIGALMLTYGGGGHANAGTCQVPHEEADRVVAELVGRLNATSTAAV